MTSAIGRALCALGAHRVVADHDEHAWRWRCAREDCDYVESYVPIDPEAREEYRQAPDVARRRR